MRSLLYKRNFFYLNHAKLVMANCKKASCKTNLTSRLSISWLPAVIIAVLPKCPFCIMAYSGALTLCSGSKIYPNAGGASAYITLGLCLVVLLGIIFNYKGSRTLIALFIALTGILFVFSSQFVFIGKFNYYTGVILLFFGIWYNGSFAYFYRNYIYKIIQSFFSILKRTVYDT